MTRNVGYAKGAGVSEGTGGADMDATSRQTGQWRRGKANSSSGSYLVEYPRPQPPVQNHGGGIRLSQVVRKPGTGRGMGGVAMGGDSDEPQSPKVPPPHAYIRGISQSQIIKKGGFSRFYQRSSSPSEGENSSVPPPLSSSPQKDSDIDTPQSEGQKFTTNQFQDDRHGEFDGGCVQAPPLQPNPPLSYREADHSYGQFGSGSSVCRGLTEEQVRNEVGWYTSGIERAVKKVQFNISILCAHDGQWL